ncbi:MAG TPA: glutamate-cysteine ligase family protein [Fimbriimonadales bacterium]|nr:glutamate-cysteine ligase family protein [Fimbriimonadales bacterium]
MSSFPVTLGVEEEVFVLESDRLLPTLQSLDYLRKLFWSNPRKYTQHTASNFAKGNDRQECFMGSVEVATDTHESIATLLDDLIERRKEFAKASEGGLVVPVGALFTLDSPTNTASTHIHVGVPKEERQRVYENLVYFLPVLALAAANSPYAAGAFWGVSYRMASKGLLGPLREDNEYRFQDIIISKRLGTIEIRIFDPIPEIFRLNEILRALLAIAKYPKHCPLDREFYNKEREDWTRNGITPFVRKRWEELQTIVPFPFELLENTLSKHLGTIAMNYSIRDAYCEADRIWREPTKVPRTEKRSSALRIVSGITGYYALRLPYIAYKGYKEWHGKSG